MGLLKQLTQKKNAIVKRWFTRVIDTYPADTAEFLRSHKDPFTNPVGQTTFQNLEAIFDLVLTTSDHKAARPLLDPIIRIRAIQDFTPARAVGFVFDLKDVIGEMKVINAEAIQDIEAWAALNKKIDDLGLLAFDIYMQCREKLYDLKANEMRERTFSAFARAGLIKEPAENEPPL